MKKNARQSTKEDAELQIGYHGQTPTDVLPDRVYISYHEKSMRMGIFEQWITRFVHGTHDFN